MNLLNPRRVWSRQQSAINDLAEDLSWSIGNLVNPKENILDPKGEVVFDDWNREYDEWCARVSRRLENRAFFTRADQLHFEGLGFVTQIRMNRDAELNKVLGELKMKHERLRDVINWTQQRVAR